MLSVHNKNKSQTRSNHVDSRRLLVVLALLLMACLQPLYAQQNAQPQSDLNWVTTWSASPSSLPPGMLPPEARTDAFTNQTLRMVLHTSAGGDVVRVRISNVHGDKRLLLGAASIGRQAEGSGIEPATLTRLTFGGEQSISISRGAVVVSDPVAFSVPQMGNLAVSLYLPEASGTATVHSTAHQTSYVSGPGDFSMSEQIPEAAGIAVWNYVTAVDVGRTDDMSTIVTLGDSITDGWGSSQDLNNRWPDYFARRLFGDEAAPDFAIANAGISGNRVIYENSPRFGENLQVRFERDVLALSGVSHIVLLEGINDIGMANMFAGEDVAPEEIIAGYRQIISAAHTRGIKIIGATLLAYEGAGYFRPEGEVKRQAVNAWIRTSGEFDGVIDFDAATRDPANPAQILPAYVTDDKLHPNDAGYDVMADAVDIDLFR